MAHVVVVDKSKPKPAWLCKPPPPPDAPFSQRNSYRYWTHIWNAQPAWADREAIRAIYKKAAAMRDAGLRVEVDHIVPLKHPLVCGLHVDYNMRILTYEANQKRSNTEWPDMPFEQLDMFHEDKYGEHEQ